MFGTATGLLVARGGGLVVGLALGVAVGIAEGLVASAVGGYGRWRGSSSHALSSVSPRSSLLLARAAALRHAVIAALVGGIGAAAILTILIGAGGRTAWLAVGMGLEGGILVWLDSPFGRFMVAQVLLQRRRHLPWQLMRFLDDAHRRGVLRQSGAVYQFRHARLRDRLAAAAADVRHGPSGRPGTTRGRRDLAQPRR